MITSTNTTASISFKDAIAKIVTTEGGRRSRRELTQLNVQHCFTLLLLFGRTYGEIAAEFMSYELRAEL